jgi:hypothetical protein
VRLARRQAPAGRGAEGVADDERALDAEPVEEPGDEAYVIGDRREQELGPGQAVVARKALPVRSIGDV